MDVIKESKEINAPGMKGITDFSASANLILVSHSSLFVLPGAKKPDHASQGKSSKGASAEDASSISKNPKAELKKKQVLIKCLHLCFSP